MKRKMIMVIGSMVLLAFLSLSTGCGGSGSTSSGSSGSTSGGTVSGSVD